MHSIFATPHVGRSFRGVEHPASEIAAAVARFQEELDKREIRLKVYPGAEVMLGAVDLLGSGGMQPEWTYKNEGNYILVESPLPGWPDFGDMLLYETALRGAIPIIAHPERYTNVQKDIKVLERAVGQGALLQITAGSLARTGGRTRECALALLQKGWVHFVASDAHTSKTTMPFEVVDIVVEHAGEARARQILLDNPDRVLAGRPLREQVAPVRRSTGWLSRLTRRGGP